MSEINKNTVRLYGAKISMFTGKVRSYLIKKNIPFVEIAPNDSQYQNVIVPKIGRRIIPVIEMSDGRVFQDSSDIIDALEAEFTAKPSAYPEDPVDKLLSLIFEFYGDEGLMRPAMHYRWNFPEATERFITHGFGGAAGPDASAGERTQIEASLKKFSGFLPMLGIVPQSINAIEDNYLEALSVFNAHFERHPYILGTHPSLGDYGLMCSLYAHLGRDPIPAGLMKNRAPSLYRWTERMNLPHDDISDMPYYKPSGHRPKTLKPILKFIAKTFLPEVKAAVAVLNALPPQDSGALASLHPKFYVLGQMHFDHYGVRVTCAVRPMLFYMIGRVQNCFEAMTSVEKIEVKTYLNDTGLVPLLTLKMKHSVSRENFQEVWA